MALTGPADLSKFPSIDPKILLAALSMPFKNVHSLTGARDSSWRLAGVRTSALEVSLTPFLPLIGVTSPLQR
jgi:hypothetical protein